MSASPAPILPAAAPRLNLAEMDVAPELFTLVPRKIAELHEVVPVFRQNGTLTVAMARPDNLMAVDELQRLTGLKVHPVRVTVEELQRALVRFYAGDRGGARRPAVGQHDPASGAVGGDGEPAAGRDPEGGSGADDAGGDVPLGVSGGVSWERGRLARIESRARLARGCSTSPGRFASGRRPRVDSASPVDYHRKRLEPEESPR